jgi:hypothetical protein
LNIDRTPRKPVHDLPRLATFVTRDRCCASLDFSAERRLLRRFLALRLAVVVELSSLLFDDGQRITSQ